jgi:hypothetical protein
MHKRWQRIAIKTATQNCTKIGYNHADWNSGRDKIWWLLRPKPRTKWLRQNRSEGAARPWNLLKELDAKPTLVDVPS